MVTSCLVIHTVELLIFHRVKPSSTAVMMFHWPVQAARQQTRRLTESWWGPSGELNVSCCAKLQKNNSSSSCPQKEDRRQRKAAAAVPTRPTMPHYYVEHQGRAIHHLPSHCLRTRLQSVWSSHTLTPVLFQSQGQFMWLCGCIINLPAVNAGSSAQAKQNMPLLSVLVHFPVGPPIHICPQTVDGTLHNQLLLFQSWQQIPSERW